MPLNSPFEQLISENEIQTLRALYDKCRRRVHPLVSVALHLGAAQHRHVISSNTSRALECVLGCSPDWVKSLKPRLLDEKDWTNSESALAEIRACGDLLRAGFTVRPGTTNAETGAKAEFHVCCEEQETIV